ncbi:MAG TPA: TatD family hydrolase [Patescibacteria group bacterium]|nr:TatD family hydrolase [Patescibacteria group bacterium]
MLELTDTHCHIHEIAGTTGGVAEKWHKAGITDPDVLIKEAAADGVTRMLCVGCTLEDSKLAIELAAKHENIWATIGIHPHEAKDYAANPKLLNEFAALLAPDRGGGHGGSPDARNAVSTTGEVLPDRTPLTHKIVAIGECGLDYFYNHSPKEAQIKVLRFQLELAQKHNLPMTFHIREAFEDFWPIFDEYQGIHGVVHSFTATQKELDEALSRGLYIALNGIATFTKHVKQIEAAKAVPLNRLLLETDAPFLTPQPLRANICEPKHVRVTAEFLAELRGETLERLAEATTKNARTLFGL